MNNNILEKVECCKYLGIILDNKISWIQHIAYVKGKISKGIGIMYQARKHLTKKTMVNLYNAYIYLYLLRRIKG